MLDRSIIRDANWLTQDRRQAVIHVLALFHLLALAALVVFSRGGIDPFGSLLGTDFLSFWTSGRMLHLGANPYDIAQHIAHQRALFAQPGTYTAFYYPPLFLPICYLLGFLDYLPALTLWLLATGVVFWLAVRSWYRVLGMSGPGLAVSLAFPAVFATITHGQTAFLVTGLIGWGLALLRERAWVAGALIGLATIKPQLGVLIPVALIATGQWRAILAAGTSAAVLAALASLCFGPEIWGDWLAIGPAAREAMANGAIGFAKMQSVFAAARLVGAPETVAWTLQFCATAIVAMLVARAGWKHGWSLELAAMLCAGALLATPFALHYDLLILAFPLCLLVARGYAPWERSIAAAAFVAPLLSLSLAHLLNVPPTPIVLAALVWALWRRIERRHRPASV